MPDQPLKKRKPGRPRRPMPGRRYSLWCGEAGWAWLKEQSVMKGHDSVGSWADAKGERQLIKRTQADMRKYGQPTVFERSTDGTNYGRSIQAVRERFGISTAELAQELGVAKRTVEGWEGGRMPSGGMLEQLRKLATRLKPFDDGPTEVAPRDSMAAALRAAIVPTPKLSTGPVSATELLNRSAVTVETFPTPPAAADAATRNPLDELEELCSQPELAELEYEAQQRGEAGPLTLCQPTTARQASQ